MELQMAKLVLKENFFDTHSSFPYGALCLEASISAQEVLKSKLTRVLADTMA